MDISKNFLFHYSVTALNKILIVSQRNDYLRSEVNPLKADSAGAAGTAFKEVAKELPAWGVQKPPRRVGEKQFPGEFSAASARW
jgi:hypothetical protein